MASRRPQRILVIQMKRIGDLILTIPAIQVLRRAFPDAHLAVATTGAAGQIVPAIPGVDEHLDYQKGRPNLALWAELVLGNWDTVLDYNGSDRTCLMTALTGAERRATYTKHARGSLRSLAYTHLSDASLKDYHTIDHLIALGEAIGVPLDRNAPPQSVRLDLPETARAATARVPHDHYAVVHPGTARAEKYWPAERWAAVIDHLHSQRSLPTVLTGGNDPLERAHLNSILRFLEPDTPRPLILAGELSLLETAAVIEKSDLALGVDTAAMHLAAAFEKPQIVLFGPTDQTFWGPRHANATVICPPGEFEKIEDRSMDGLTVESVLEVL